jgi:alcohol dehydrogenase class IV
MSLEVSIIIAVIGAVLSLTTFFIGRQTSAKNEGQVLGLMSADIKHIKELTHKIESNMQHSQQRIHERIDEVNKISQNAMQTAVTANSGQQSAHKRIDEIQNIPK